VTGTDRGTKRRIARVVLRGKHDPLSDEERRRAARYAAIVTLEAPYQAVQCVTLLASILVSEVGDIFWPPRGIEPHFLESYLTIAVFAVLAVLTPITALRVRRRTRRWAAMRAAE